jgi:hypothetical protein
MRSARCLKRLHNLITHHRLLGIAFHIETLRHSAKVQAVIANLLLSRDFHVGTNFLEILQCVSKSSNSHKWCLKTSLQLNPSFGENPVCVFYACPKTHENVANILRTVCLDVTCRLLSPTLLMFVFFQILCIVKCFTSIEWARLEF